jgi:hypothetical protein
MPFSDDIIQQVWEKGAIAPPNAPNLWRKDFCGAWIYREYYGNRNYQYGWEIDHKILESEGGENEHTLSNRIL